MVAELADALGVSGFYVPETVNCLCKLSSAYAVAVNPIKSVTATMMVLYASPIIRQGF